MYDKFEKYLKKIRPVLDVEEPDDMFIWEGIKAGLHNEHKKRRKLIWRAAAVLLILVSGGIMLTKIGDLRKPQGDFTIADISSDLAAEQEMFQVLINTKYDEIKMHNVKLKDYPDFADELEGLEKLNREFLADLQTEPANPRLIKALLNYYHQKIRILEKLLMEIEKNKSYENEGQRI